MKFNIQSKQLLSRLSAISKVISTKNAYAILDNFLFELEGERLVITGSDMETRITSVLEVPGMEGSGKFAIDVKRIQSLLKELPDTAMTFEIDDETLEVNISYLNGRFNAMALNGDDYPAKPAASSETVSFQLSERDIVDGIQHTVFAVGLEEVHPQFMGVFWDIKVDGITFVASDSHKLVRYQKLKVAPGIERSFILPTKAATVLSTVLDGQALDPVNIVIDDSGVTFEATNLTLTSRLINSRYPNYHSVIPAESPYSITLDRASLLNAVRRVSVFTSVGGLVRLELTPTQIQLTTRDLDHSTSAEETIACEYTGMPMSIGFKNTDIIEVLNNLSADTILLKLTDPTRAGIFYPEVQADGEDLLILQMPMVI